MYKHVIRTAAAILLLIGTTGCEFLKAVTFEEAKDSGYETKQTTQLLVVQNVSSVAALKTSDADWNKEIDASVAANCKDPSKAIAATIAGFAVSQGIDLITGALNSIPEKLKKKSEKTYKASFIPDVPSQFGAQYQCLIFVRKDAGATPKFGLIAIMKVSAKTSGSPPVTSAFTLEPVYLRANNAMAVTGEGKPLKVSLAFVGKAAKTDKGTNKVDVFGQSTLSVPEVMIGKAVDPLPSATGLIPMPPDGATALELLVAVTESGSALPDDEKAKSELKTVSEAIGTFLKDQVKKLFPEEK